MMISPGENTKSELSENRNYSRETGNKAQSTYCTAVDGAHGIDGSRVGRIGIWNHGSTGKAF